MIFSNARLYLTWSGNQVTKAYSKRCIAIKRYSNLMERTLLKNIVLSIQRLLNLSMKKLDVSSENTKLTCRFPLPCYYLKQRPDGERFFLWFTKEERCSIISQSIRKFPTSNLREFKFYGVERAGHGWRALRVSGEKWKGRRPDETSKWRDSLRWNARNYTIVSGQAKVMSSRRDSDNNSGAT